MNPDIRVKHPTTGQITRIGLAQFEKGLRKLGFEIVEDEAAEVQSSDVEIKPSARRSKKSAATAAATEQEPTE